MSNESQTDNGFLEKVASAAKDKASDIAKDAANNVTQGAKNAVGHAADSIRENASAGLSEAARRISSKGDNNGDGVKRDAGGERCEKRRKPPIIAIAIVVLVCVALGAFMLANGANRQFSKDDFVTSSALEKAISIENLSTAEFVYNGVAEKYRDHTRTMPFFLWESDEPVEYRILYKATVKAGINMRDVGFDVNNEAKTITVTLPPIELNPMVEVDGIQFIPQETNAKPKDVLEICEADVTNEAKRSNELYSMAEDNLRSTIEALTLPIIKRGGYVLKWKEQDAGGSSQGKSQQAEPDESEASGDGSGSDEGEGE